MDSVRIIPFNETYIEKTFKWIHNPRLRHDFLMRGETPTFETHFAYFQKIINDPGQEVFAILCDDAHIGNCGLKNLERGEKCELWIYIGEENFKKKGVGFKATKQLMAHARNESHVKILYLHVARFNIPAIRLYKKLGFKETPLKNASDWMGRGTTIIRMESSGNR